MSEDKSPSVPHRGRGRPTEKPLTKEQFFLKWRDTKYPHGLARMVFSWNDMLEFAEAYAACSSFLPVPEELEKFRTALTKINDIRNSLVGFQSFNFSEHAYPLVAALDEAGFEGMPYPEAMKHFGTMLERTLAAEARVKELESVASLPVGESRDEK